MKPYQVAMIQTETHVVVRRQHRDDIVSRNLDRILELLDWVFLCVGKVRLVVTPEYSLMDQFRPRSLQQWLDIALPVPNEFTERAAAAAARLGQPTRLVPQGSAAEGRQSLLPPAQGDDGPGQSGPRLPG